MENNKLLYLRQREGLWCRYNLHCIVKAGESDEYIVFSNDTDDGEACVRKVAGKHIKACDKNDHAQAIIAPLIDAHNQGLLTLNGEQYTLLESSESAYSVRETEKPISLSNYRFNWGWLSLALIVGIVYAYAYVHFMRGVSWFSVLFPTMSRNQLVSLIYTVELFGVLMLFLTCRKDNLLFEACANAFIPLNFITMIAIFNASTIWATVLAISTIFLSIYYALPYFLRWIKSSNRYAKANHRINTFSGIRTGLSISAFIGVLCVVFAGITPIAYQASNSGSGFSLTQGEYEVELEKLQAENWNRLAIEERLTLLQTISDYECSVILGCGTCTVTTCKSYLPVELGSYSYMSNTISINMDHLMSDDVEEIVNTILHETKHHWQYEVYNIFLEIEANNPEYLANSYFAEGQMISDNIENYISSSLDAEGYYFQYIEADCRWWAINRVWSFYESYIYPDTNYDWEG